MTPSPTAHVRFAALIGIAGLAMAGCSGADLDVADDHGRREEGVIGTISEPLVASDPISAAITGTCSTGEFKKLSDQLIEEIQCLKPGTMKRIDKTPGLVLNAPVSVYLQTPAADALIKAQKARGKDLRIISGLRTLPQQYVLYQWYLRGLCDIPLAAPPGKSNHQSGIAVDIEDNAGWRSAMQANGFKWLGAEDPAHFHYDGGPTADLRELSVRAFQRLWNRNHPNDMIAEDGAYGPATETRIAKSPVGGFTLGPTCADKPPQDAGTDAPSSDASSSEAGAPSETPAAPVGSDEPPTAPSSKFDQEPAASPDGCALSSAPARSGAATALFALAALAAVRRRRR